MEASTHAAPFAAAPPTLGVFSPPVNTGGAVRVVVLADVRLYRDGLVLVLSGRSDVDVVGHGPANRDGITLVCSLAPNIVLIEAPAAQGTTIVRDLAARLPTARVVAYGVSGDDRESIGCAEAGVAGYVPMDATSEELIATALSVARGEFACSPRIAALMLRRLSALAAERQTASGDGVLTPRERQVGELIDDGLSNKEIAVCLGIEVSTVKNHVHNLMEKLHAKRRVQAAARIRRAKI